MSLLVHKLVIGSGGGSTGSDSTMLNKPKQTASAASQASRPSPSGSAQLFHTEHQPRHTSLACTHTRITAHPECGNRLVESLAGHTQIYSGTADSRTLASGMDKDANSSPPSSSACYYTYSAQNRSATYSRSSYNLPFVLQDHNYGAPPPPTPPHSPPPLPVPAPSIGGGVLVGSHQKTSPVNADFRSKSTYVNFQESCINNNNNNSNNFITQRTASHPSYKYRSTQVVGIHNLPGNLQHLSSVPKNLNKTVSSDVALQTAGGNSKGILHNTSVNESSRSAWNVKAGTSPTHGFHNTSMFVGAPRQQFMPQPAVSAFPSPYIPPPPTVTDVSPVNSIVTEVSSAYSLQSSQQGNLDTDDDSRLSDRSSSVGPSGEETETAPEGEGDEHIQADDSITRCVCDFTHDDGYMIQCDRCFVWQHVDCMEIDRNNIPDEYLCEACDPRLVNKPKARSLQVKRRQEIKVHLARTKRLSSSDSDDNTPLSKHRSAKNSERKVLKKKKTKPVKEKTTKKTAPIRKKSVGVSASASCPQVSTLSTKTFSCSVDDKDKRPAKPPRRRQSSTLQSDVADDVQDIEDVGSTSNQSVTIDQLHIWIEDYERAVTNHYSPELRARVHAARINGISADLKASSQGAVLGHRCKVVSNQMEIFEPGEKQVLAAATRLKANTAIIEYQGKYLLQSQWSANNLALPCGVKSFPFVLKYEMLKEGLVVCVDARTYGNEARFARRSCEPNAEIHHLIERGSLHLYIVSSRDIEEDEEIVLPVSTAVCADESDIVQCTPPTHSHPGCRALCLSGVKKEEVTVSDPENDSLCKDGSSDDMVSIPEPTPTLRRNGTIHSKKAGKKATPTQKVVEIQSQTRTSRRSLSSETSLSDTPSSPLSPKGAGLKASPQGLITPIKQRRASGGIVVSSKSPSKSCRSPRKSPSHSPVKSPMKSPQKSPAKTVPSNEEKESTPVGGISQNTEPRLTEKQSEHKMTREERKIAAYMKAFERMEKACQRKQEMEKKREEERGREKERKHSESPEDEEREKLEDNKDSKGRGKKGKKRGSPHKRNNSGQSETASDDGGSSLSSPSDKCSSAPVSCSFGASGFRFPKTKKALMNEWLNETIDPVHSSGSNRSSNCDLASGVPMCYMRTPATPVRRPSGSYAASSTAVAGLLVEALPGCSAKKRWLRQAISEETDPHSCAGAGSPSSRPDSPVGSNDYITPLKKRRLARESMSSEHSSTPPSTPVHTGADEVDSEAVVTSHIQKDIKVVGTTVQGVKLEIDDVKVVTEEEDNSIGDINECKGGKIESEVKVKHGGKIILHGFANTEIEMKVKAEIKSESADDEGYNENESGLEDIICDSECKERSKRKTQRTRLRKSKCGPVTGNSMDSFTLESQRKIRPYRSKKCKRKKRKEVKKLKGSSKHVETLCKSKKLYCDGCPSKKDTCEESDMSQLSDLIKDCASAESKPLCGTGDCGRISNTCIENEACVGDSPFLDNVNTWTRLCNLQTLETISKQTCDNNKIANLDCLNSNLTCTGEKFVNSRTVNSVQVSSCDPQKSWDTETSVDSECGTQEGNSPEENNSGIHKFPYTVSAAIEAPPDMCRGIMGANDIKDAHKCSVSDMGSNCDDCAVDKQNGQNIQEHPEKPAPIKRKLSILEYRKRKSVSTDREKEADITSVELTEHAAHEKKDNQSAHSPSINSPVSTSPSSPSLPPSPVIPPSLLDIEESAPKMLKPEERSNVKSKICPSSSLKSGKYSKRQSSSCHERSSTLEGKHQFTYAHKTSPDTKEVKWSEAPTLVEQQRENLTERLRREFGLNFTDDEDKGSPSVPKSKVHSTPYAGIQNPSVSYPQRPYRMGKKVKYSEPEPSYSIGRKTSSKKDPGNSIVRKVKVEPGCGKIPIPLVSSISTVKGSTSPVDNMVGVTSQKPAASSTSITGWSKSPYSNGSALGSKSHCYGSTKISPFAVSYSSISAVQSSAVSPMNQVDFQRGVALHNPLASISVRSNDSLLFGKSSDVPERTCFAPSVVPDISEFSLKPKPMSERLASEQGGRYNFNPKLSCMQYRKS